MKRLFLAALMCLLVGCSEDKPTETPPPVLEVVDIPTVDQSIAAMMREYNFDKVCHDSKQGFFVYFPVSDKDMEEDPWQGWYVTNKFKFYPLSNGTYVTVALNDSDFTKVHPDITGLECSTQKPPPSSSK